MNTVSVVFHGTCQHKVSDIYILPAAASCAVLTRCNPRGISSEKQARELALTKSVLEGTL